MDTLLDIAPCGFLSFSEDGTILQVNQTLATWLDYKPLDLEKQSLNVVLSMGGRVLYQTHFFPLLKLQGYVEEFYFSLRSKSGEAIPMLVNAQNQQRMGTAVYDCVFMRMVRRDQYENQTLLAMRQAQFSDQAKADILTMLSHEFRTPLNAMLGFAEMLEMEMQGQLSAAQKEYIAAITTSSEDILRLTSTILEFAELTIGQVKFTLQPIQVPHVLKQVEVLMAPTLSSSGIHYSNQPITNLAPVISNSVQLQRIVVSLLENALKFTDPGGKVSITCSQTEELVQIQVSDTGCGIPTEYLQLIFEPFVRVNPTQDYASQRSSSRAYASAKGIGLGLAISRHLARAMGGEITVVSVLGKGSTFTVSLPKYKP